LAAYREAGVDLPILSPPVGVEAALDVIRAFGPVTGSGAAPPADEEEPTTTWSNRRP
jgi:hypothetical protein